jgi:hypothetical protein
MVVYCFTAIEILIYIVNIQTKSCSLSSRNTHANGEVCSWVMVTFLSTTKSSYHAFWGRSLASQGHRQAWVALDAFPLFPLIGSATQSCRGTLTAPILHPFCFLNTLSDFNDVSLGSILLNSLINKNALCTPAEYYLHVSFAMAVKFVQCTHLGPATNLSFSSKFLYYFVAPSLTRGPVCNLPYKCSWAFARAATLNLAFIL